MPMRSINLSVIAAMWTIMTGVPVLATEPKLADSPPDPPVASSPEIEALLEPIRQKHKVPGLIAGIVQEDRLMVAGAVGIRKLGSPDSITINDKLHIGSGTKAMTATLIARLGEQAKV